MTGAETPWYRTCQDGGRMQHRRVTLIVLAIVCGIVLGVVRPGRAEIGDLAADRAIGQDDFTSAAALPIGPATFAVPKGVAIDRSVTPNRAYVSDSV